MSGLDLIPGDTAEALASRLQQLNRLDTDRMIAMVDRIRLLERQKHYWRRMARDYAQDMGPWRDAVVAFREMDEGEPK